MSAALLGIVVNTLADDYDRLGRQPSDRPDGSAIIAVFPAVGQGGLHGWWSARLSATTFTEARP